jgi:hypothetical protein
MVKRILVLFVACLALAAAFGRPAAAQAPAAKAAGIPPIIDRELFFGDPEIAGAQISPDRKSVV